MVRTKMTMNERARQFLPFDALKGFKEALRLKEYENEKKKVGDLSEESIKEISDVLSTIKDGDMIELVIFTDGYEKPMKGKAKLNVEDMKLKLDGNEVSFDSIRKIKNCSYTSEEETEFFDDNFSEE